MTCKLAKENAELLDDLKKEIRDLKRDSILFTYYNGLDRWRVLTLYGLIDLPHSYEIDILPPQYIDNIKIAVFYYKLGGLDIQKKWIEPIKTEPTKPEESND